MRENPTPAGPGKRISLAVGLLKYTNYPLFMALRPSSGLWFRIALPIVLFVAVGSLILVSWLQAVARQEAAHVFQALARTNAEFIKSARLPPSERMAESLGHVLGMRMFFRKENGVFVPLADNTLSGPLWALSPEQGIVELAGNTEAIAMPLEPGVTMILVRPGEHGLLFLLAPATRAVLGAFWLLSLALAWSITRGVVRPLQQLSARLPQIETDPEPSLPGAERGDEIGQVARAYLATRAQLAEERERRTEAERFAILGRMATGLAHEIHNPLSTIRLHAQMLNEAEPAEVAALAGEAAPVLLSEAVRIEGLVNQWMFLARPAPPNVSRAVLGNLLAAIVQTHSALARHAGVTIAESVPENLVVSVDSRRLSQALSNIVLNAIQAMPNGGHLEIIGTEGCVTRLAFRDTGPGFSQGALLRYAELFYSEKEGGMGIGLSVSSEILKAHGGALRVGNAPGGGAMVTLELPRPETDP